MSWDHVEIRALTQICTAAGIAFGMRSAVGLALLDMTRDSSMGVGLSEVGSLNAKGQVAYSFGKLFGGAGVDVLGGRRSQLAVLALLAGSFAQMARVRGTGAKLTVSFSAIRFAIAVVWSAAAVSLRGWFHQSGQAEALSFGQTALRAGASLGSLLGGFLLAKSKSWRALLNAYACLGFVSAIALSVGLSEPPSTIVSAKKANLEGDTGLCKKQPSKCSVAKALKVAAATPKLFLLYASTSLVTATFDLGTLLPQFLSDEYHMEDSRIGSIIGAFPLAGPPTILAASGAMARLQGKARIAFLMGMQSLSVLGYLTLASRPRAALLTPALVAVQVGITPALACVPPDWIMRWGGPHGGLFAGLNDVGGNVLSIFIYSLVPRLVKTRGWPLVMRIYALQVALGAVCMAGFQALEAAKPTVGSPFAVHDVPVADVNSRHGGS